MALLAVLLGFQPWLAELGAQKPDAERTKDELVAAMQARCYSENRTLPELAFTSMDLLALVAAGLIALTAFIP